MSVLWVAGSEEIPAAGSKLLEIFYNKKKKGKKVKITVDKKSCEVDFDKMTIVRDGKKMKLSRRDDADDSSSSESEKKPVKKAPKKRAKKPPPSESSNDSDSEPAPKSRTKRTKQEDHETYKQQYQSYLSANTNTIIDQGEHIDRTYCISPLGYIRNDDDDISDTESVIEAAEANPGRWASLCAGLTTATKIKEMFSDANEFDAYDEPLPFSCSPRPGVDQLDINTLFEACNARFEEEDGNHEVFPESESTSFVHAPVVSYFKKCREDLQDMGESDEAANLLEKKLRKLPNYCDLKYAHGDGGHSSIDVFYVADQNQKVIAGCLLCNLS